MRRRGQLDRDGVGSLTAHGFYQTRLHCDRGASLTSQEPLTRLRGEGGALTSTRGRAKPNRLLKGGRKQQKSLPSSASWQRPRSGQPRYAPVHGVLEMRLRSAAHQSAERGPTDGDGASKHRTRSIGLGQKKISNRRRRSRRKRRSLRLAGFAQLGYKAFAHALMAEAVGTRPQLSTSLGGVKVASSLRLSSRRASATRLSNFGLLLRFQPLYKVNTYQDSR
jgi:hypothetical protein